MHILDDCPGVLDDRMLNRKNKASFSRSRFICSNQVHFFFTSAGYFVLCKILSMSNQIVKKQLTKFDKVLEKIMNT